MKTKRNVWKHGVRRTLAALAVCLCSAGSAASDDARMVFSTRGPDHYADGAPVQEGEMYALVWTRAGSAFAGFDLNGDVLDGANNALVTALPLAKRCPGRSGAHCPATLFRVDAAFAKRLGHGTYALALLDTRVADGRGGLRPSGRVGDLKGWGLVAAARATGGVTGAVTTASAVPPAGESLPTPRITGIRVVDGLARLTVTGTSPRLLYNVTAGASPGHLSARRVAVSPQQGLARTDGEIELVVPVRDDRRFFTVTQN